MAATEMAAVEAEAVSSVKCYCCGLTEECTPRYIDRVKEKYQGRWICGLCAEAVKEEALKSQNTDEALNRHMKFRSFTLSPPNKPTQDLIIAMKHLLLRSLDSHSPLNTLRPLGRSQSCFSTMSATTKSETQSDSKIVRGQESREVITTGE